MRAAVLWFPVLCIFTSMFAPLVRAQDSMDLTPREVTRRPFTYTAPPPPVEWKAPSPREGTLAIDLPSALRLVHANSLDIALASERIKQALAQNEQAKVAWLPNISIGPDYYRHGGRFQDAQGNPILVDRTSFNAGVGISAVFAPGEVFFGPLATRQIAQARQADLDTATNNVLFNVAEAYFNVQQARGELFGALDTVVHATELVRRGEKLAPGLAPPVEAVRARAELSRRKQAVHAARERWQLASAELGRILRLDPAACIEPIEPPHLRVSLLNLDLGVDALIPVGLRNRPELASQQALVEATLSRLKQERIRPLVPSIILSGAGPGATNPSTISVFGAGNDALRNYGARADVDLQMVWVLQNLGLGNRAKVKERQAENRAAVLEMFRLQDRVAAEVAQASAQARSAADRILDAEAGLKDAADSVAKNFQGLSQTRRTGELIVLLIRPQEVVAAIQALARAYSDYYGSVGDFNRAQFRLYRALGCPGNLAGAEGAPCAAVTSGSAPSHRD